MNSYKNVLGSLATLALVFGLVAPLSVSAATTPSLGSAASYGILASTYTNTSASTTVNGDIGFTTGPAVPPGGAHTNYGSGNPYTSAGAAQASALSALAAEPCTYSFPPGAVNLSTDTTHGAIGVYVPGVYCSSGAMDVGGPLTLTGSGTYIFRPDGALTSTAGASVNLSSTTACDVFWTPTGATTLAANTTFSGTIIDDAGITIGANTAWTGRALAFNGTVTTDTDTLTAPSCAAATPEPTPVPEPTPEEDGTITVTKVVINDDGGTDTVSDFPLFVDGDSVVSGASNDFPAGDYQVTETSNAGYTATFSGDCDSNGDITVESSQDVTCTITNNDISEEILIIPEVIDEPTEVLIDEPVDELITPVLEDEVTPVVTALPVTGLPSGLIAILSLMGMGTTIFVGRKQLLS